MEVGWAITCVYWGSDESPCKITKFYTAAMTVVKVLTLNSGENQCRSATISSDGNWGFFGMSTNPGMVVKV